MATSVITTPIPEFESVAFTQTTTQYGTIRLNEHADLDGRNHSVVAVYASSSEYPNGIHVALTNIDTMHYWITLRDTAGNLITGKSVRVKVIAFKRGLPA